MSVTGVGQQGSNLFDVLVATGFEGDVDDCVSEADAVVGAVVSSLHDVGAGVCEDAGELVKRSGAIGEVDAEAGAASIFDESALDDAGEEADVDVASADYDGGALAT